MPPLRRLLRCACALLAPLLLAGALAQPVANPAPAAAAVTELGRDLPLKREEPASAVGSSWIAATVLLAIAAAAALLLRRQAAGSLLGALAANRKPGASLVRLGSQPLTTHASLHAVRWNGEELLLACTAQQVTLIARRPAGESQRDAA
jgi:flagellar biogenesis protein FliO